MAGGPLRGAAGAARPPRARGRPVRDGRLLCTVLVAAAAALVLANGVRWRRAGAGSRPGGRVAAGGQSKAPEFSTSILGAGGAQDAAYPRGAAGGEEPAGSDGGGWPSAPAKPAGRSTKDSPAWDGFTFPGCQPEEWDERIRTMLAPWAEGGGIRREAVWEGIREYGIGCIPKPGEGPLECERTVKDENRAGVGLGFYDGKAYLLEDNLDMLDEAGQIVMGSFHVMLELEKLNIPDVEFFLVGTDASHDLSRKKDAKGQPRSAAEMPPVMHYCTHPDLFSEVLVPGDYWFHVQNFDERMAKFAVRMDRTSLHYDPPKLWYEREEVLGCNCGGHYHRHEVDTEHPWRALGGQKGAETICATNDQTRPGPGPCSGPRSYYESFLSQEWRPDLLKSNYFLTDMERWHKIKYILFMDGITCSTRLQQYLMLGFSTFVAESGYQQYFQPFLEPWKHYVPVWNQTADQGPEDLVDKVELAKAHDEEARALGENAFAFANITFKPERRLCYWETLLKAYAHLQTTPPKKPGWALRVRDHVTSRPGCGEVSKGYWHWYDEAYKVGPDYNKRPWSPDSAFCHPDATAYDSVVDPCPGGLYEENPGETWGTCVTEAP